MRLSVIGTAAALLLTAAWVTWRVGFPPGPEDAGSVAAETLPGAGAATDRAGRDAGGVAGGGSNAGRAPTRGSAAELGEIGTDASGGSGSRRAGARHTGQGAADGLVARVPTADEDGDGEDGEALDEERELRAEHLDELDAAYAKLGDSDLDERLDAIDDLTYIDPELAQREAEKLLARESDPESRLEAFEKLMDITEDEAAVIQLVVGGLSDPSPEVRDFAAYWLSTEDADRFPEIRSGLQQAYANERDPDVRDTVESALESVDPDFVPPYMAELDADFDDDDESGQL